MNHSTEYIKIPTSRSSKILVTPNNIEESCSFPKLHTSNLEQNTDLPMCFPNFLGKKKPMAICGPRPVALHAPAAPNKFPTADLPLGRSYGFTKVNKKWMKQGKTGKKKQPLMTNVQLTMQDFKKSFKFMGIAYPILCFLQMYGEIRIGSTRILRFWLARRK